MHSKIVTIVIPVYKVNLSLTEQISLKQCIKLLDDFDIVFVHPESLDVSTINFDGRISSEKFPDHYFKSVFRYNRLMLTASFYERFSHSKFILIYQLDAYVFRDELLYWCSKNYDYIGAPWISTPNKGIKKVLSLFESKKKKARSEIFYKVGNGGFSLRKVSTHIANAKKLKSVIEQNLNRSEDDFRIMEDVFWSSVPKIDPSFLIPDYKEGLKFAFDRKPKLALKLNNNKLPFGCHGFEKPKVKMFWSKMIP